MKINVAIIFGGKSVEHEISVISALQAAEYLDREKYNPIPIYITKQGKMYTGEEIGKIESYKSIDKLLQKSKQVILTNEDGKVVMAEYPVKFRLGKKTNTVIDVVLPIVHGTNVEDGTLQGYLKTLGVPFAGCDVLASAVGMDKHVMKLVFRDAGIPVLDSKCFLKTEYVQNEDGVIAAIEETFTYPVIVKPVNLGSSVGIKKADDREALAEALDNAFLFANTVLVERAIVNLREINCAVLGDLYEAEASECEEPLNATDILSYEDKYLAGGKSKTGASKGMASLARKIPADITPEMRTCIREMAVKAFRALGGCGVARIDFMIDTTDNTVYLNEINTIPGSLSFYLWEPLGVSYKELLDRMIRYALKRARDEAEIVYSFDTNVLDNCSFGGAKGGKLGK
ncbi:MAG: D-alanine--D-alanine ligase [Oscillospiraceae bacterium]|nr:D-alanine--D-alanine ligase [Oscillospiraceae bacterium]